jgi:hypothetical protein
MLVITFLLSLIISGCSGETVKHLEFTNEELDQIKVTYDGDYKIFTIPNRNWIIKAYLPEYRIAKGNLKIFQATRHYDGEEMITVIATIIDPRVGCKDLTSCFEYRMKSKKDVEGYTIFREENRIVISKLSKLYKTITILTYYDNVCIDIFIILTQINQRGLDNAQRIADSVQIIPR